MKKILIYGLMFMLLLLPVFSVLTDDLVSYYTHDNAKTNGTTSQDSIDNFDGIHEGSLTTGVSGIINEAYQTDSNSEAVNLQTFDLNSSNDFSFQLWWKPADTSDGQKVFGQFSAGETGWGYVDWNSVAGGLRTCVYTPGADCGNIAMTLSTAQFYHIVVVHNNAQNTVVTYLNGTLLVNNSVGTINDRTAAQDEWNIGTINGFGAGDNYVSGILDEVGIWNRSLTPSEVTELWNNGSGLAYPFTGGNISANPPAGTGFDTEFTSVQQAMYYGLLLICWFILVALAFLVKGVHGKRVGLINLIQVLWGIIVGLRYYVNFNDAIGFLVMFGALGVFVGLIYANKD